MLLAIKAFGLSADLIKPDIPSLSHALQLF
jgi:hypothetical protein